MMTFGVFEIIILATILFFIVLAAVFVKSINKSK